MLYQHLVRYGQGGHIGRFRSLEHVTFPRGSRVVCRTTRGLELGQVLSSGSATAEVSGQVLAEAGDLLRKATGEDELLEHRLVRHRDEAFGSCRRVLREKNLDAVLIDVEVLFDGKTVYFYFMGDVSDEVEAVTAELAETFEAESQIGKFASMLTAGCGPDCGTEEGSGCSNGSCATCVVASACGKQS